MSNVIIFDTSILVDYLRTGRHEDRIGRMKGIIRNSAVVLAELRRGAYRPADRKFLRDLKHNHPVLAPTEQIWSESGEVLSRIYEAEGYSGHKLRDLHFDVLIALTARSVGARVITSNRRDFELISSCRKFQLEIW
jgi:predicted nucleic acid-binding protein